MSKAPAPVAQQRTDSAHPDNIPFEVPPREFLDLTRDVRDEGAVQLLREILTTARKIVVIAGAGISVAAGIPDFRGSKGMFAQMKSKGRSGQMMFDSSVYRSSDSIEEFHEMIGNLYEASTKSKPTPFHNLLESLAKSDRLLRLYTQNIDFLDTRQENLTTVVPVPPVGPWPKVIAVHGSLAKMTCTKCRVIKDFNPQLFRIWKEDTPECIDCKRLEDVRVAAGRRPLGVGFIRPRMVLYGEPGYDASNIGSCVASDLRNRPDTLIVVGTTLKIPGTRTMVKEMSKAIGNRGHVIWLNVDDAPGGEFSDVWDFVVKGDCQKVAELMDGIPIMHKDQSFVADFDVESTQETRRDEDTNTSTPRSRSAFWNVVTNDPQIQQTGLLTPAASIPSTSDDEKSIRLYSSYGDLDGPYNAFVKKVSQLSTMNPASFYAPLAQVKTNPRKRKRSNLGNKQASVTPQQARAPGSRTSKSKGRGPGRPRNTPASRIVKLRISPPSPCVPDATHSDCRVSNQPAPNESILATPASSFYQEGHCTTAIITDVATSTDSGFVDISMSHDSLEPSDENDLTGSSQVISFDRNATSQIVPTGGIHTSYILQTTTEDGEVPSHLGVIDAGHVLERPVDDDTVTIADAAEATDCVRLDTVETGFAESPPSNVSDTLILSPSDPTHSPRETQHVDASPADGPCFHKQDDTLRTNGLAVDNASQDVTLPRQDSVPTESLCPAPPPPPQQQRKRTRREKWATTGIRRKSERVSLQKVNLDIDQPMMVDKEHVPETSIDNDTATITDAAAVRIDAVETEPAERPSSDVPDTPMVSPSDPTCSSQETQHEDASLREGSYNHKQDVTLITTRSEVDNARQDDVSRESPCLAPQQQQSKKRTRREKWATTGIRRKSERVSLQKVTLNTDQPKMAGKGHVLEESIDDGTIATADAAPQGADASRLDTVETHLLERPTSDTLHLSSSDPSYPSRTIQHDDASLPDGTCDKQDVTLVTDGYKTGHASQHVAVALSRQDDAPTRSPCLAPQQQQQKRRTPREKWATTGIRRKSERVSLQKMTLATDQPKTIGERHGPEKLIDEDTATTADAANNTGALQADLSTRPCSDVPDTLIPPPNGPSQKLQHQDASPVNGPCGHMQDVSLITNGCKVDNAGQEVESSRQNDVPTNSQGLSPPPPQQQQQKKRTRREKWAIKGSRRTSERVSMQKAMQAV